MWGTFSFFSEEKKEPKKSRLAVLPHMLLSSVVLGSYIREVTLLFCAACLAQSQRRLLLALFMAHASYNLYSFRDSANDLFLYRQFFPRAMFATPRRLNCRFGGEVHARRKVGRARKQAIPTRYEMYS